jgi:hypothetical protein
MWKPSLCIEVGENKFKGDGRSLQKRQQIRQSDFPDHSRLRKDASAIRSFGCFRALYASSGSLGSFEIRLRRISSTKKNVAWSIKYRYSYLSGF